MKKLKLYLLFLSGFLLFKSGISQTATPIDTVCVGSTNIPYNVQNTSGSTYQWAVTGNGNIINSGNGTNAITINWSSIIGVDTVSVIETNSFGCIGDPVKLPVVRIPLPTVNAGPDGYVCEGSVFSILSSSAQNYSGLSWATLGTGTFSSPNTLVTNYTPSAADIINGSVVLYLTAYGITPCGDAVDSILLTIIPTPTVFAGTNSIICQGNVFTIASATATNYSSFSWSTSGSGTFANGGTLSPTYIPSAADISAGSVNLTLTVNGNSPCANIASTMTLSITPASPVEAGNNETICEGSTLVVTSAFTSNYSSILWTTSGTGIINNNGTISPTYIPSAADIANGSVTLYLTAYGITPCLAITDSMVLTIIAAPNAYAGINSSICYDGTFTLSSATASNYSSLIWTSSGTGSYNNATTLNPVYTPSAADITAGTVVLTLTAIGNSPCTQAVSTLILTINPKPVTSPIFH